jgi:glycosyltransferase involved in cell wall biosynthesis
MTAHPGDTSPTAPRVHIGLPTRDGGPYLEEALDSILAQTFRAWRLVVSENGSGSPELAEVLAPYLRDARIAHVKTGYDVGMAGNHTRLIQMGEAPYVAILHDDDRWEPEFLQRRVGMLDERPEAGLAFGRYVTIDHEGRAIAAPEVPFAEGVHGPASVLPVLVRRNVIGISTAVVRRSAYEAVGSEFVSDIPMMDYEMWCRLAARFPVAFLDVTDAGWRWHGSQTSQRVAGWGEVWLRFYGYLDDVLAGQPEIAVDRRFLRRQRARSSFAAALDALEVNERDRARSHLLAGVSAHPLSALDPRALATAAALPFGGLGTRPLLALRRLTARARRRVGPLRAALAARLRGSRDPVG